MSLKVSALSQSASKTCDDISKDVRASGVAPNAACGFARRRKTGWDLEIGGETAALFDWASVTKSVFATAFAASGRDRSATVGAHLKLARSTPAADAPLELLLAHRAGFPAHLPLFAPLVDGVTVERDGALVAACRARTGELPAKALYSDVGYLLAGFAVHDGDAADFMLEHVISPLGLERELGSARSLAARGVDVVSLAPPTEFAAWRGGEVRGRVHDENAWALGGDASCAHAGLFGTIGAALQFGVYVLEGVKNGEFEWLVRARDADTLRAGFDGKSALASSAGTVLGPRSFGHLGFTGTSLWIDPDAEIVVSLLSNRVCPTRANVGIRAARPRVHDALARAALER